MTTKKHIHKDAGVHVSKQSVEWIFQFWAWQLLAWSLYRYFFRLPEHIDEFLLKPFVFVMPVFAYLMLKEHRSIESVGLTFKKLFPSLLIGLSVGLLFALEALGTNFFKYGKITLNPLSAVTTYGMPTFFLLSLATAFSEELLSRGFYFTRLYEAKKNLLYAIVMSTLLFVAFHIPVLLTQLKFQGTTLIIFFLTTFAIGFINSVIFSKTKSLVAPILIHLFWNITVAIFL